MAPRLGRGAQAALDESGDETAAIGGVGMQIVRRIDCLRRRRRRLADQSVVDSVAVQQRLHLGQPLRPMARADNADMGVADPAAARSSS